MEVLMKSKLSNLANAMRKNGLGRVSFQSVIGDIDVTIYLVLDLECETLFIKDNAQKLKVIKLISPNNNEDFIIPAKNWADVIPYFFDQKDCFFSDYKRTKKSIDFEVRYKNFMDYIVKKIELWLGVLTAPSIRNAAMVDYTELLSVIYGDNVKKYCYFICSSGMKKSGYEKAMYAFGKVAADLLQKNGKCLHWNNCRILEHLEVVVPFFKGKDGIKQLSIKGAKRFLTYDAKKIQF